MTPFIDLKTSYVIRLYDTTKITLGRELQTIYLRHEKPGSITRVGAYGSTHS
jgi:hypothetical protein